MEQVKSVRQRVLELVAAEAVIAVDAVRPKETLEAHGLDSLDRVEVTMRLEDEFGIEVPDHDWQRLDGATVDGWVEYVEQRRGVAA